MENSISFQCMRCGKCCNPCQYDAETTHYIPIYLDEVERIKILAKQKNLEILLEPDLMYYDELNNRLIIVTYALQIENGGCPFYQSECIIHMERPITCKAYPLSIYRYKDTTGIVLKPECSFVEQNSGILKNLDYYELSEVFSDEFPFSREIQILGNDISSRIIQLEIEKKIQVPVKFPVNLTEETKKMSKIRLDEIK